MDDDAGRCFSFDGRFSEPVLEDDEEYVCGTCGPDQSSALGDSWCVYSEGVCLRIVGVDRGDGAEGRRR